MGLIAYSKLFPQFAIDCGDSEEFPISFHDTIFLIDSLLHVMNLSLPIQDSDVATIAFSSSSECPICYKESRLIILNCEKSYWCQVVYQLAHEMCHLMIPGEVAENLKWLEESICELSSYIFLPKIKKYWLRLAATASIDQVKASYAPFFEEYVLDDQLKSEAFDLASLIGNPDSNELSSLISDCCMRNKNTYIAINLLPIFKTLPLTWHAVPYLGAIPPNQSLSASLKQWIELSPTDSHMGLQKIANLFGAPASLAPDLLSHNLES